MSRIKTLFEGKGWYLERKYEHPEEAYIDAFCFVSSNDLPTIATKFEIGSEKYNDYWAPILSRMQLLRFDHEFNPDEGDVAKFDYIDFCHVWLKIKQ